MKFFLASIYLVIIIQFYGNTISNILSINGLNLIDDILMILMFIVLIFKRQNRSQILSNYIYLFIVVCVVSASINTVSLDVFILQIRSYLLPVVVYFIVPKLGLSREQIIRVFKNIVILSIPVLISALFEYVTGQTLFVTEDRYGGKLSFDAEKFRIYSTIGNPIDYSNMVIIMICIFVPSFVYRRYLIFNKKNTIILSFAFFVSLFMSASRGPILALIVGLLGFFLISKKVKFKSVFKLALFTSPAIFYYGNNVLGRFSDFNLDVDDGYRALWLSKAMEIVKDNLLFGVGPGKFGGWISINYKPSYIYDVYNFDTDGISSIDMFFPHLMGETGIIGLISYVLIYRVAYKYFKNALNKSNSETDAYVASVAFLLIPMLMIIGMTSISLETQLVLVLTFLIIGLSEQFLKLRNENNTSISN